MPSSSGSGAAFPDLVFFVYIAIVLVAVGMGFYLSYLKPPMRLVKESRRGAPAILLIRLQASA
jgi:hypothetical protein